MEMLFVICVDLFEVWMYAMHYIGLKCVCFEWHNMLCVLPLIDDDWIWCLYVCHGYHAWIIMCMLLNIIMIVEMFCVALSFHDELQLVWVMYVLYFHGCYNMVLDLVKFDVWIAWFRSLHWMHGVCLNFMSWLDYQLSWQLW